MCGHIGGSNRMVAVVTQLWNGSRPMRRGHLPRKLLQKEILGNDAVLTQGEELYVLIRNRLSSVR